MVSHPPPLYVRMKLLALMLLLSSFSSLTLMEVMEDVNMWKEKCGQFFIRNQNDHIIPDFFPLKNTYEMICQRWKNQYRFATLYDTKNRIPVYSAYTFTKEAKSRCSTDWKIEPQLENIKAQNEMMDSPPGMAAEIRNQAIDLDYRSASIHTRGHVYPCGFSADDNQGESTFTLTNIAPQTGSVNKDWEEKVEQEMLKKIKSNCLLDQNNPAYIITGAGPGKTWISIMRDQEYEKGINIPSHFWSVFLCTKKNDMNKLLYKAYIMDLNTRNVRNPTLDTLDKRISKMYRHKIFMFPGLPTKKIEPLK